MGWGEKLVGVAGVELECGECDHLCTREARRGVKAAKLGRHVRTSLCSKCAARLPRLSMKRNGSASAKYGSRMLSRVLTAGPTGSAECHVLSATANA